MRLEAPASLTNFADPTAQVADYGDLGPPTFPALHVVVRDADEAPSAGVSVYALWREGRGTDNLAEVPHATTDESGTAVLHVLRAGRYFVGATDGGCRHVAPVQVDVPRAQPFEMRLARCATVAFALSASLVASVPASDPARIVLVPQGAGRHLSFPGPNETRRHVVRVELHRENQGTAEVRLPMDETYAVASADWVGPLDVDPWTIAAPTSVGVSRGPEFALDLDVRYSPAGQVWRDPVRIEVDLEAGGHPTSKRRIFADVPRDQLLGFAETANVRLWVPDDTGTLRWRGTGLREGSMPYAGLARDRAGRLTIVVEVEHASTAPHAEYTRRRTIRVGSSSPEPVAGMLWVWGAEPGQRPLVVDPRAAREAFDVHVRDTDWVAARSDAGDLVAGPVRAGEAQGELRLVSGGHLRLSSRWGAADALGAATIERADGAPLFVVEDGVSAAREGAVPVVDGLVLGPLPEGRHEFAVRVGGVELGRVRANVAPGKTVDLPLRRPGS